MTSAPGSQIRSGSLEPSPEVPIPDGPRYVPFGCMTVDLSHLDQYQRLTAR